MKTGTFSVLLLAAHLWFSPSLQAFSSGEVKALWIEVREGGEQHTIIALTEGIARAIVESEDLHARFSYNGKREFLTRAVLKAVLDGDREKAEVRSADGAEATVTMGVFTCPSGKAGKNRLVLETRRRGEREFRMVLPEISFETGDEDTGEFLQVNFGWKGLLPRLQSEGGALYIKDAREETELLITLE